MSRTILSLAMLLTSLPTLCAETLAIDPSHTAVIFSWTHQGFSHPVARLEKITGEVLLDRSDITRSSVSLTMPLDGLRTGSTALDSRLRGVEFFDAVTFPAITFKSTKIETVGTNALKLTGDLSVHGITKSVALAVTINKIAAPSDHSVTAGFDADVLLRRSDFGLGRYVPMTGDELSVHITLEAAKEG
jgi:polyisoprenoid-binding protein YceI